MKQPDILDSIPVVEQTKLRPCGHGLTGRRVRNDLYGRAEDAFEAARTRVLDHAAIWKPTKGFVEDQALIAKVYGERQNIAIDRRSTVLGSISSGR
jgi:hypothetical protein